MKLRKEYSGRNPDHLLEAESEFTAAIAILHPLVETEGRRELANDLARTFMNRGVALMNLGRLDEAVTASDAGIAILRPLVEQDGRRDLANDLATALFNRSLTLKMQQQIIAARKDAWEAESLWVDLVTAGQKHLGKALADARALVDYLNSA